MRNRWRTACMILVGLAAVMSAGCHKDDEPGVDAPLLKNAPPPPGPPPGKPVLTPGTVGGHGTTPVAK